METISRKGCHIIPWDRIHIGRLDPGKQRFVGKIWGWPTYIRNVLVYARTHNLDAHRFPKAWVQMSFRMEVILTCTVVGGENTGLEVRPRFYLILWGATGGGRVQDCVG